MDEPSEKPSSSIHLPIDEMDNKKSCQSVVTRPRVVGKRGLIENRGCGRLSSLAWTAEAKPKLENESACWLRKCG